MSTIKADAVTAKSTNTDVVITGAGTGVPDIEANFKVGGVSGVPLASIRADAIDGTKIADDSINSEHYVAASIDNEHLADDAVGIAELSATGTASSSVFLRGDNTWAAAGGGKILQVVSAFDDEFRTYSNTQFATPVEYTQLQCAITPAATSSKIYLSLSLGIGTPYGQSGYGPSFLFKRDSTIIGSGDKASRNNTEAEAHATNAAASNWDAYSHHLSGIYVDSPSTTSAVTYKVFVWVNHVSGGSPTNKDVYINSGGYNYNNVEQVVNASQLVAMEIGA